MGKGCRGRRWVYSYCEMQSLLLDKKKQRQDCGLYVGYSHKTCGPHDCYMGLAKVWDEKRVGPTWQKIVAT